jgi:hypothetical protein
MRTASILDGGGAVNAHDQNADLDAANDIPTSPRSSGARTRIEDGRGPATTIAARREPATALGAADWLGLAAAPAFAAMALLTGVLDGGPPDILCLAAHDASPLGGMVPMYVLMSAFHSAPWLKLTSGRQSGARRS